METQDVDLSEFYQMAHRDTCKVKGALDSLKPAERKQLSGALGQDAGRIPHAVIRKWIEKHCPELGAATPSTEGIKKHRTGVCSCA